MNTNNLFSENFSHGRNEIILLNGQVLSCTSMDSRESEGTARTVDDLEEARQSHHRLFAEHAWLFYNNAEKILNDSRMFLAPVYVQNHLAFVGTAGFENATLGTYIEWWLHHSESAIDANGHLVWYIAGSPLSGRNSCSSATPQGQRVDSELRTPFIRVWRSFHEVNARYSHAKLHAESFSLQEVINLLSE